MTKKRIISFTICVSMLLSVFFAFAVSKAFAAISVSKVAIGTSIDSKYAFTPRFITGKTTFESFGGGSYESDLWETDGYYFNSKDRYYTEDFYPIRLTSADQKGNVGVWYKNVGTYQGKVVNMKVTVAGWDALRKNATLKPYGSSTTKTSIPTVVFSKYNLGVWQPTNYIKNLKIKVDFYDEDNNTLKISGHLTFRDMDATEKLTLHNSEKVYLTSNSILKSSTNYITGDGSTAVTNSDSFAWSEVLLNDVSSFTYNYSRYNYDAKTDWSTKAHTTRSFFYWAMEPQTITSFKTPTPTITGQTSAVPGFNDDVWDVSFFVPMQPSSTYYYNKFVLTDSLPKTFSYKSAKITDDTGADVTAKFTISCDSNNVLTATLGDYKSDDSFYNKTYHLIINGAFKDMDYKEHVGSDGSITFTNKASLTTNNGGSDTTSSTGDVATKLMFKLKIKVNKHYCLNSYNSIFVQNCMWGGSQYYDSDYLVCPTYIIGGKCALFELIFSSKNEDGFWSNGLEIKNIYFNGKPSLDENEKVDRSLIGDKTGYHYDYSILKDSIYSMYEYGEVDESLEGLKRGDFFGTNRITQNSEIVVETRPLECELKVTKKVLKENVNKENGNPVAIYKCEGIDIVGVSHTYYKATTCNYIADGCYTGTVRFANIPAGDGYKVQEINQSRFNCDFFENVNFVTKFDVLNLKQAITDEKENNIQTKWQGFSHNSLVVNSFKKQ